MKYYIHHNGGKIYYSDHGQGRPVVLLHGYLESSEIWGSFAEKLASACRVISVDLPGHGQSRTYGDCHSMEFMASALKSLIDSLNLRKIFLTGHSLGGYVALAFAELYPGSLSGYCLFHSHPFSDTPETIQKREREISLVRSGKKYLMYPGNISMMFARENLTKFGAALQHSKDIAAGLTDEGIIAVLNGMMIRPARINVMEKGEVPYLWILGRKDEYISCESAQAKVKTPPGSRVEILENSGHMGFVEEEDQSLELLISFIDELLF